MSDKNIEIERNEDAYGYTKSKYTSVPGEEEAPTEQEKIINRFFFKILNDKNSGFKEIDGSNKRVVTLEHVCDAWNEFKKEWYENKNA